VPLVSVAGSPLHEFSAGICEGSRSKHSTYAMAGGDGN